MRIAINANIANVVANQRNIVAVVRLVDRQDSDTSRLFGPAAGKKHAHASKHAASFPTASGERGTERTERSYRMFAACPQGRLWRQQQLSTLLPATLCLGIAG